MQWYLGRADEWIPRVYQTNTGTKVEMQCACNGLLYANCYPQHEFLSTRAADAHVVDEPSFLLVAPWHVQSKGTFQARPVVIRRTGRIVKLVVFSKLSGR